MEKDICNRRYQLMATAAYYDMDKIWISNLQYNGLYYYDIPSGKTEFVLPFPEERHDTWRLHGKIVMQNQELYFLPDRASHIHVFNKQENTLKAYDLSIQGRINCKNAVCHKDKIYFVSEGSELTLCSIDTITKRIEKKKIDTDYKGNVCRDMLLVEDNIYIALRESDIIIMYSIENDSFVNYKVDGDGRGFGTICFDGVYFWLSNSGGILRWDKKTEKTMIVNAFPKGFGMTIVENGQFMNVEGFTDSFLPSEKPFEFSVLCEDYILFFPYRTNMIIKLNLKKGILEEFYIEGEQENLESLSRKGRITLSHYLGGSQKDYLVFISIKSKAVYIKPMRSADKKSLQRFSLQAKEPEDLPMYIHNAHLYQEEVDCSLEEFIDSISKGRTQIENEGKFVGKEIYNCLKS